MLCQHPNCSYPIYSICANHCHWSLCEKHINEHGKSLITDFEELLEGLIKPTNELSNIIETTKTNFNLEQQKQLHGPKQSHEKQIHEIEQKLIHITKFQEEFNKMSDELIQIKSNDILLTHNHFQQITL